MENTKIQIIDQNKNIVKTTNQNRTRRGKKEKSKSCKYVLYAGAKQELHQQERIHMDRPVKVVEWYVLPAVFIVFRSLISIVLRSSPPDPYILLVVWSIVTHARMHLLID